LEQQKNISLSISFVQIDLIYLAISTEEYQQRRTPFLNSSSYLSTLTIDNGFVIPISIGLDDHIAHVPLPEFKQWFQLAIKVALCTN